VAIRYLHLVNINNRAQPSGLITDRLLDAVAGELRQIRVNRIFHSPSEAVRGLGNVLKDHFPIAQITEHAVLARPASEADDTLNGLLRHLAEYAHEFEGYFERARASDQQDVLLCHADLIYYFVCRVLDSPLEARSNMQLTPGSFTRISIVPDGKIELVSFNDTRHL
jgi:hypothetical protein